MLGKVVLDPDIFYALKLRFKPITRTFGIFKDIVKHFFSAKIIKADTKSNMFLQTFDAPGFDSVLVL